MASRQFGGILAWVGSSAVIGFAAASGALSAYHQRAPWWFGLGIGVGAALAVGGLYILARSAAKEQDVLPTAAGATEKQAPESWQWYAYHADQRLKNFNFFAIFVGALFLLIGGSAANGHPVLARLAAGLGVLLSVGFFMLDVRNARMVDITLEAIEQGDGTLAGIIRRADKDKTTWAQISPVRTGRPILTNVSRHRFVLRTVMLAAAVVFIVLACIGPS